ncbi:MAG: methionyl-tRNA formyltransferase [Akkermansiaceae bacterium]|nr:methionyl-tRNA formyltransferase [Akkermansiaceae bacterium]MDP4646968.1 methionyl-tRNA formyltransferase [Akkermansiaceae bacterium]MDP4720609.1 methionyl-tRNA formyltransferase [Akkermansiaceae bacterium]MDP4780199.1 methionyl-tRNA formyltransferase [Akkermansiaceae bacterium]MDP4847552.1 methionyl-tRNA formyltransferase [Akkermansiaceae bacterium]
MKIAFIATGDIALPTFRHLIEHGPKPCLLITQPDKPVGRSQSSTVPPEIKTVALAHGIPVWQPEKIGEIADELTDLVPEFIVVMAYGQIIGKAVRKAAKKAIINLHASILPKYRGASCIQSAIANGDPETGITIMHVIRELDAGDIISVKKFPIGETETAGELHDRLADIGPAALSEALEILSEDPNAGTPQNPEEVTYAPKLLREHGRLDFTQSASSIERKIRAYHPWPGTFTEVSIKEKNKRLKIFPPISIVDQSLPSGELIVHEGQLLIGCGEQSLALTQVQPEGSKQMPATAFANSL